MPILIFLELRCVGLVSFFRSVGLGLRRSFLTKSEKAAAAAKRALTIDDEEYHHTCGDCYYHQDYIPCELEKEAKLGLGQPSR